jgi:Fe-S-cluster containining protein
MHRDSPFSYLCNRCGRCCHDQVLTLSPYDLIRIARVAGISTGEAIARYTLRRGSLLRFKPNGECAALSGTRCTIHGGRPLACRLYPLGLEWHDEGSEHYIRLEPAPRSLGVCGTDRMLKEFLAAQGTDEYLSVNRSYVSLLGIFRDRIGRLVDFELVDPREFWRIAVREALAETNFDPNPLSDALFDPDRLGCRGGSDFETVEHHLEEMKRRINRESDAAILASAAVLLAVTLGYSPGAVIQ